MTTHFPACCRYWFAMFAAMLSLGSTLPAAEEEKLEFKPLFNGKDLSGWVNVNCAPSTFQARDGLIVSSGKPTGVLRTERMYQNFVLELEYKHIHKGGNAGIFIWSDPITSVGVPFARSIEVQVLDGHETVNYTSHGDVFAIHGATFKPDRPHPNGAMRCLPSEKRALPAGEWNHYRIDCRNGVIQLAVNGKVVSGGSASKPQKGYICLESEGSECHFRHIQISEMPDAEIPESEIALPALGHHTLYTGLDLAGWKLTGDGADSPWKPRDWTLVLESTAAAAPRDLWTEQDFGDFELICDWRLAGPKQTVKVPAIQKNGDEDPASTVEITTAGDSGIMLHGSEKALVRIGASPIGSGEIEGYRRDNALPDNQRTACIPQKIADQPLGRWNRFVIRVRLDHVSVTLNGQLIIEDAALPDLKRSGPIGLKHGAGKVEFANLLIRPLQD